MTTRTEKRKQFLFDVFVTAIEGGINYWTSLDVYHWMNEDKSEDLDGFYAVITDTEDDDQGDPANVTHRIDIDVIARGLRLFREYAEGKNDGEPALPGWYGWQLVEADKTNGDGEDGDYDSTTADMVVQFGLFGEVLYG